MDSERWKRLEEVFFAALECAPGERDAYVRQACGDDDEFRREVVAVLAAHETSEGTGTPDRLLPSFEAPDRADARIGTRIGAYRLEELVGRGGMGEVYRASRADDAYHRIVALKIVRSGRSTPESVRRFRNERQILATLEHPNISPLIDGGVTESGEPYLVMPFVDGVPITRHAREAGLSLHQRLRLFRSVLDAVQYAHANLVVHRDLKPSNILVGSDGRPMLLDFGIAKPLQGDSAGGMTGEGALLTPDYAAPEQFLGHAVTTATDVYALGVLLYELTTDARPFGALTGVARARAVCESDPPPPSRAAPPRFARALRGDLDLIVLKAMHRDPGRRYASAGQFSEDVERWLAGRPVIARPDSLRYRVGKFVRRNVGAVAATALALAVLVGATIVTARESARRAQALRVANAERARATRISEFLIDVFESNDPSEARGREVTARELLDRAAARVRDDLRRDADTGLELELAIGRAYHALGLGEAAAPLLEHVASERRAAKPADPLALANALEWKARNDFSRGDVRRGVAQVREALGLRERALGPESPEVAHTLTILATYLQTADMSDSSGACESAARRSIAILRATRPVPHRELALALRVLGQVQLDSERQAESLETLRASVAEARLALHPEDPLFLNMLESIAIAHEANGQSDSAIAIHRSVLATRERVVGVSHPDFGFSLYNLARSLTRAKRYDEGLTLFQRAVETRERVLGPTHYLVGTTYHSYAVATAQSGDLPRSAERFRRAATLFRRSLGPRHRMLQDALEGLAIVESMRGRPERALDALEEAVDAGYDRAARLRQSPFDRLAGQPRFRALLERVDTARRETKRL